MGAFDDFDPTGKNKPATTTQPAATPASTGGAFSDFNPTGKPAATGDQGTGQPTIPGGQGGDTGASQSSGWGIDWSTPWYKGGPSLKQPQGLQDWSDVAGNEAMMGTLPGLRTQAEAARRRLGPDVAATADLVGAYTSPSQLLNLFGGPEVAGAVHEGLKSYNAQPNWIPTQQGAEKIAADTAIGGATGGVGRATAAATPALTRLGVAAGIPMAGGGLAHLLFGQGDPAKEIVGFGGSILGALGAHEMINDWSKSAANFMRSPAAKQAVKSLILGGGSAARNYAGPSMYDQWIPNQ